MATSHIECWWNQHYKVNTAHDVKRSPLLFYYTRMKPKHWKVTKKYNSQYRIITFGNEMDGSRCFIGDTRKKEIIHNLESDLRLVSHKLTNKTTKTIKLSIIFSVKCLPFLMWMWDSVVSWLFQWLSTIREFASTKIDVLKLRKVVLLLLQTWRWRRWAGETWVNPSRSEMLTMFNTSMNMWNRGWRCWSHDSHCF